MHLPLESDLRAADVQAFPRREDLSTDPVNGFVRAFTRFAGRRAWLAGGLLVLGGALESAGLVLLIPILHVVTATGGARLQGIVGRALGAVGADTASERLAVLLVVFVGLTLARAAVLYGRNLLLSDLQAEFVEAERGGIMRRLAAAPWSRIVRLRHARIVHLMGGEMHRLGVAAGSLGQGASAASMLMIQWALAFVLAPRMAAAALVVLLAGAVAVVPALRRARETGAEAGQASLSLATIAAGFLGGLKAATAQNAQAGFVAEFEAVQARDRQRRRAAVRGRQKGRLVLVTAPAFAAAAVVWVGFNDLGLRPAVLITVVLIFARMINPMVALGRAARQLVQNLPAFEAIRALDADLDAPGPPCAAPDGAPLQTGPLVLSEVGFRHPGGGGVRAVSLTLEPGAFVGLAGPSGAGKTTLADLVTGILEPQEGRVTVAGRPPDDAWREHIAYVGQDGFLFHDTVRRNLTWGGPAADESALWRALEMAGADGLVRGLEHGLDTVVGERGGLLSGGERQRIAIARALVRLPRLLVLDEATNAIDVAGETALLDRLAGLEPRPTIVMIAHRAESLVRCDRVVTLARETPPS